MLSFTENAFKSNLIIDFLFPFFLEIFYYGIGINNEKRNTLMSNLLIQTINTTLSLTTNLLRAESYRDTVRLISYIGTEYESCVFETNDFNELVEAKIDFDSAVRVAITKKAKENTFLTPQETRERYYDEDPKISNWYEAANKIHQATVLGNLRGELEALKPLSTEQNFAFENVRWILNARSQLFATIDSLTSKHFKVLKKDNQYFISSPLEHRHHFLLKADYTSSSDFDFLPELDELTALQNYISNSNEPLKNLTEFDQVYKEYVKLPRLIANLHLELQHKILLFLLIHSKEFKLVSSKVEHNPDGFNLTLPRIVALYEGKEVLSSTVFSNREDGHLIAWNNLYKEIVQLDSTNTELKESLFFKHKAYDGLIRFSAKYL